MILNIWASPCTHTQMSSTQWKTGSSSIKQSSSINSSNVHKWKSGCNVTASEIQMTFARDRTLLLLQGIILVARTWALLLIQFQYNILWQLFTQIPIENCAKVLKSVLKVLLEGPSVVAMRKWQLPALLLLPYFRATYNIPYIMNVTL